MFRFCPLLALFTVLLAVPGGAAPEIGALEKDIAAQVKAARAILDPWHAARPRPAERKLHLVYWTPSDREPAVAYRERLSRVLRDIQKFYADEMERIGFGRRTIGLQDDADGLLKIHLVKGGGPFADYGRQSGSAIRKECLPTLRKAGIDPDRETLVIFCNMGNWDEETLTMSHKSPYYAGGSHVSGTAWQLDEPILDTLNLAKKKPIIRDGEYGRISIGKHNSIFIGGVAHELGHALSLPHNRERPDERAAFGTALMGSGNRTYADERRDEGRGSFLTLAHAMRLASHPQFSGSAKGMTVRGNADWSDLKLELVGASVRVSGKVRAKIPVYGVVAYTDPAGGGDYNATTYSAVPAADGSFSILCNAIEAGKPGELRLFACHANGSTSRQSFGYGLDVDGALDISSAQHRLALMPMIAVMRDRKAAEAALEGLPVEAREIGFSLLNANRDRSALPIPAGVEKTTQGIRLTDTKPSSAKVGWGRAAYDRVPDGSALLSSGGKIFVHGIYAHAPARHVYQLDGNWSRLAGKAGMADGKHGKVAFKIKGDGRVLWRSKPLKSGTPASFDVPLTGVKELELLVDDGGDGPGGDWGLWLQPVLKR